MSPPPPTGTKIAVEVAEPLAQDLEADRALAGDDERIVERMDERHARSRPRARRSVRFGVGVVVADEHDLGAHVAHRLHLDLAASSAA